METRQAPLWTRNFCIFFLTNLFISLGTQFLTPTLPLYASEGLGVRQSQVGYLLTAYSFAALFIRPFAGYAYDCIGRRNTYLISLIIFTIIASSYPFAATFFMLVLFRFTHGLAFGMTSTGGGVITADIVPPARRGEGVGYFGLTHTISMALGPALGLAVIKASSYRTFFIFTGIFTFCALILANFINFPPYVPRKKKFELGTFFEKRVLSVASLMLLASVVSGGVSSYVLVYGQQDLQLANAGSFFFINSLGVGLTRLFAGRYFDKYGPKAVVLFGFLALAAGLLLLAGADGSMSYLLAAFVYGFGNGMVMPTLKTMMINMVEPECRGVANSTFYAFIDLGIGGGSTLLGYIAGLFSIRTMFLLSGLYMVVPLLYFLFHVLGDYEKKVALASSLQ
ncbi:MAG TPA: MFS transporter [Firmicutes bacterium]|nr:MFS transporter [Bacillota bacterium]